MAKELYIYSSLYDFTAETVVKQLNGVEDSEDLTIRMNTPGGYVTAGWSIISKLSERKSKTTAVIDGDAASMGAMMLVFMDKVVANDTSQIMFHKAAYPKYYQPSEAEKETLNTINKQFKEKLTAKISGKAGADDFLNKVFDTDVRNDVYLTPYKAKLLGIVDEVRKLKPSAHFGSQIVAFAEENEETNPEEIQENNKSKIEYMDLAKLKAEHPSVYAEIFSKGKEEGIQDERDRVEAWAVFNEIDPEKVKAGIESGNKLSQKAMAEFQLKSASANKVEEMESENPDETDTPKSKEN